MARNKKDVLKTSEEAFLAFRRSWNILIIITFRFGMFFMLKKSERQAEYFSPWTLNEELPLKLFDSAFVKQKIIRKPHRNLSVI